MTKEPGSDMKNGTPLNYVPTSPDDKMIPIFQYDGLTVKIARTASKDEKSPKDVEDLENWYVERKKLNPKVQEILSEELKTTFVNLLDSQIDTKFRLETPRHRVYLSKRDSLEIIREIDIEICGKDSDKVASYPISGKSLKGLEENMEKKFGYPAHIGVIGGQAKTPITINENTTSPRMIHVLAHEAAHKYLQHKPINPTYIQKEGKLVPTVDVGIFTCEISKAADEERQALNETSCDMIAREVSKYAVSRISPNKEIEVRYNLLMERNAGAGEKTGLKGIIQKTESMLRAGKIEEAERFMKETGKRLGETINQASLAVFKRYATISKTGVYPYLKALEKECFDVKEFAETVSRNYSLYGVIQDIGEKRADNEYYAFTALGGHGKDHSWEQKSKPKTASSYKKNRKL